MSLLRLLGVALATFVLASGAVHAKPNSRVDSALRKVVRDSERLLDKLEYQRARESLEAAARSKRYKQAKPKTRARMWALLGRARAELGDSAGMEEAFYSAVRLDRRVPLNKKKTSPKILAALERARLNAPLPEDSPEDPPELALVPVPPPKPKKPEKKPKKPEKKPKKPEKKPKKPEKKPKKPEKKPKKPKKPEKKPKKPEKKPKKPSRAAPELRHHVEGALVSQGRARVVIEPSALPKNARLLAFVREAPATGFAPHPLTTTGTVTALAFQLTSPKIELYVEARVGRKRVASLGSERAPIVLHVEQPPGLEQAWAHPPPAHVQTTTTTRSSTITAAAPPPVDGGLGETEIALLAAGGIAVVLGITIVAIVLASSGSDCDAEPGFGCTEIQVLPLMRF